MSEPATTTTTNINEPVITTKNKLPNCIFGGCALNVSRYVYYVMSNIYTVTEYMDDYRIFIYYDESTDNTLELLNVLANNKCFAGKMNIIVNSSEKTSKYRTKNIAKGRNWIHDRAQSMNDEDPEKWKHMIMFDMDDICSSHFFVDVLFKYFDTITEWDCLTFNRPTYYDIWALSYSHYIIPSWSWGEYSRKMISIMMQNITQELDQIGDDELFPVNSAFNGFAIYKLEKFKHCTYNWKTTYDIDALPKEYIDKCIAEIKSANLSPELGEIKPDDVNDTEEKEECEHRSFHQQATSLHGARIRISPHYLFYEPKPNAHPWKVYDNHYLPKHKVQF
jgi:hypothetical protein